jgi:hypothetical protein
MEFQMGVLHIRNWERLVEMTQFKPNYLHQRRHAL